MRIDAFLFGNVFARGTEVGLGEGPELEEALDFAFGEGEAGGVWIE